VKKKKSETEASTSQRKRQRAGKNIHHCCGKSNARGRILPSVRMNENKEEPGKLPRRAVGDEKASDGDDENKEMWKKEGRVAKTAIESNGHRAQLRGPKKGIQSWKKMEIY